MNIKNLLLFCLWGTSAFSFTGKSFMTYRPQGLNLALINSGWQNQCTNNNASIAIEYTRSFDAQAINNYFFGCNELIFSGSRVENRNKNDILADYFGLPTDFKSSLRFSPRIQNVITQFNFYWNLDDKGGFNLHVISPLVYSKWELNPCETVINPGELAYPAGYMSNARLEPDQLPKGALEVLSCGKQFGDLRLPLQFGRIVPEQHTTKFADVLIALGYNFICSCNGQFGADLQVVIPTGTRAHATNLFEPQVGNGHHWALGAGFKGSYNLVGNEESDCGIAIYFNGIIQHLFKTTQKRSYDLKNNGMGSRYMLLEDMINGISIAQGFSPIPFVDLIDKQYITRLFYAIDATTLASTIKIDVQTDIVAQLKMHYCNWHFDVGYNFWGRSAENLVSRDCLQHKFYGIKGDAQIYGFLDIGGGIEIPIPLNATQSQATLNAPQGNGNTTDNFVNNNADNAALMYNVGSPITQTKADSTVGTGVTAIAQVNGSNQAIVLTDCDINECSGLSPRALSHKIFGAVSYALINCNDTTWYLTIGAEGEFAGKKDCVKTAISQWGAWVKASVNY